MLKIVRKDSLYFAFSSAESLVENKKVFEKALSESTLKSLLYEKGYSQIDIETAFQCSSPDYFTVGRW